MTWVQLNHYQREGLRSALEVPIAWVRCPRHHSITSLHTSVSPGGRDHRTHPMEICQCDRGYLPDLLHCSAVYLNYLFHSFGTRES